MFSAIFLSSWVSPTGLNLVFSPSNAVPDEMLSTNMHWPDCLRKYYRRLVLPGHCGILEKP